MDTVNSNIQRDISRRYSGAAKPHRKAKNVIRVNCRYVQSQGERDKFRNIRV